jgi:hypothetical protein
MANEITLRVRLQLLNGSLKEDANPTTIQIDQTTQGSSAGVQTIGAGEEAIVFGGDITSEGYLYLHNLDETNFITYGPDDTGMTAFGKLKPGEFACLRMLPGVTIIAEADTAACKLKFLLLDD